jgi:hypothetical protein
MNPGIRAEEAERVPLAVEGRPAFYLVQDSSSSSVVRAALEDMVRCIKVMSGAEIPNEKGEGLIPLYLGEARLFSDLPFTPPKLGREDFVWKVTPDAVYLLGGGPLGTQHAVYTLLRELGCRWIMPGEIGECIPTNPNLSLAVEDRVESPDFEYRIVWYAYGCSPAAGQRYAQWLRRNRMGKPNVQHGHNLTNTLARKAPFSERPELYSLVEGKRVPQQICTANPEAVALVTESIREYLNAHPGVESYSLCEDDNTDFCECEKCRALDTGHMDRGGKPSISDRYQTFLNQVLAGLSTTHPKVRLTTYSYNKSHTDPPQKVKVNPNTTIFATSSAFCAAHGIGDGFCASRQDFLKLLSEWTTLTPWVYIYEYDPVPYSGGLPWPTWESRFKEMKEYKALGVKGVSIEGQNSWAPYFPNYYVAGQMMWNSGQDGDRVFHDMLASFFAEAAPAMEEYYASLESKIHLFQKKVDWGLQQYPHLFPAKVVEKCGQALAMADELAKTPIVKQRLEMVRLSYEEMKAYLAVRDPRRIQSYEEYKAEADRLGQAINQMAAINEDYILARIAHEKTGNAIGENYAPQLGFFTRWQVCGVFDNTGMLGHDKPYPPEAGIDLAAHYEGKGGKPASWKPTQSPEQRAYVDLCEDFEDTENVAAYAACWVTMEGGPKQAEFRMGSNDSIKAFLNGKEIWNNKVQRTVSVDEDRVTVTLPAGTSSILVKIGQTGLNWGFYFRIMEPKTENSLPGLVVSTTPPLAGTPK